MRLSANLLILLLLLALSIALAAGLIEQSLELQHLTEMAKSGQCLPVQSGFSHLRFVGYHLALFVLAIATVLYLIFLGAACAFRWLAYVLSSRLT